MASCPITSWQTDANTVQMVTDFILGSTKSLQIVLKAMKLKDLILPREHKIRPEADCGSDQEMLIAKFGLKFKKVGKTIRPFKNDLYKSFMSIQWK